MQSGLSLHRRNAHPYEYHLANVPKERKKARWEHEEMVFLARREIEMARAAAGKVNVRELASLIPDRTYDAVKGVRRKTEYKDLLTFLSVSSVGTQDGASSMPSEETSLGSEAQSVSSEEWTQDWAADLIKAVEDSEIVLGKLRLEDIVPGQPSDWVREAVDTNYEAWLPSRKRRSHRAQEPRKVPEGARANRRAQYARVQRCYDRDRTRCAQEVIMGAWRDPPASLPMSTQEPFWHDLFEAPSVPDSRSPSPVGGECWELLRLITHQDVTGALKKMKDGAPGPDGRKLSNVKAIPAEELAGHFNLWLLAGYLPSKLRRGETVLLPKCARAEDPAKYRPITMSDIVVRCFHRILAQQMEALLPFNTRQKAFRASDGVADSVWFIQAVIKHHQDNLRPLNVAFVDVKKAFDSVSHQSILVAAACLGVPTPFLGYIHVL